MSSTALPQRIAARGFLDRLKLPYLTLISGIVLGVAVSTAFVDIGTDAETSHPPGGSATAGSTSQGQAPMSTAQSADQPAVPIYYFIVGTDTPALDIAEALGDGSSAESHFEFVVVTEDNEAEAMLSLDTALMELSQAGVNIHLLDLR